MRLQQFTIYNWAFKGMRIADVAPRVKEKRKKKRV